MKNGADRLARRLSLTDAVIIGLGAMIGAGIFAAPGPAAAAAGSWLLAGLVLASVVAYANATSSAQLAALYPESGGTYVYARQLGEYWGFLAGWSFVVGKAIENLTMPVMLVQGSRTAEHFKDAVRHVSSRLDDSRVIEIQDVGHLGHVTAPQAVAEELVRFFGEQPNESGLAAGTTDE